MTMVVFAGLLVGAILVASLGAVDGGKVGDSCQTPNSTAGTCTVLTNCPLILDAVKAQVRPAWADTKFLQSCRCGTFVKQVPVVCCPDDEVSVNRIEPVTTALPSALPRTHPNLRLINARGCGRAFTDKIINGVQAELSEFPWMAVLSFKHKGEAKLSEECGGTLITPKYVLTAAHCIKSFLKRVTLGEHDLRSDPDCQLTTIGTEDCSEPVQHRDIKRFIKHPKYSTRTHVNDIALIELKTPVRITANVKTICLPMTEVNLEGKSLSVAGWGVTEQNTSSQILMKANVHVMNLEECYEAFLKKGLNVSISDNQLCAGGDTRTDSCNGDSGGPLKAFPTGQTAYVQYGIVSYGLRRCATPGVPAVYTAVERYVPWILDNITP